MQPGPSLVRPAGMFPRRSTRVGRRIPDRRGRGKRRVRPEGAGSSPVAPVSGNPACRAGTGRLALTAEVRGSYVFWLQQQGQSHPQSQHAIGSHLTPPVLPTAGLSFVPPRSRARISLKIDRKEPGRAGNPRRRTTGQGGRNLVGSDARTTLLHAPATTPKRARRVPRRRGSYPPGGMFWLRCRTFFGS
jgi:hypothetical protein